MNTSLGYSKKTLTDSNVLLSGGGDKALSEFIGSLNWDSTNKKLQYKNASSTNFTDLITFGSNAFTSYSGYNIVFLNNAGTTVDTFKALTSPSKTLRAGTNVQMTAANNVITITATDTTYSTVSKTAAGLCPALPNETTTTKYLRLDGSWTVPAYPTKASWNYDDVYTKKTLPIPVIVGPSTDTTAGTWTGTTDAFSTYVDGLTIIYVPAVAGASTTTLNINGLGAKTCHFTNTSKLTTHFAVGTPIMFTYYGGYWKRADYDSNSNTWRNIYTDGTSRVGTGNNTKAMNFVQGDNITITYLAAGTSSGLSGSADYFNIKIDAVDTWIPWQGATSSAAGTAGYMPAPTAAQYQLFLRGDGTWVSLNNYSLPTASNSTLGGVKTGAAITDTTGYTAVAIKDGVIYYKDTTYTFYNLQFQNSGGTTIDTYKPTTSPTKTLKAGSNVTISAASNVITIASTNTWNANAVGVAGYVAAPTKAANANMTWLTDTEGVPAWRASNNHTHDYLPISGGTMTGNITMGANSIVFNQATTSNWNVAANTGITLLNTIGTSATGAPGSYHVGLSVSGYYGFQLAAYGGGGRLLFRNTERGNYTSWSEIAYLSDIPSSLPANGGNAATVTTITKAQVTGALGYTPPTTNSTYNFSGTTFRSGYSSGEQHDCNSAWENGHYYYNANGPSGLGNSTTDGALYVQSYNSSWVGQIAQDYRNGRLWVRGKNNGTWQSWVRIANYNEVALASHTHAYSQITDGTSSSTNSDWSRILSNTYGGSLKSILYMCHGGGYGMHIRGYSTSASVYMLQIYNSSKEVFGVYGDGHSNFGGNVNATNYYTTSDCNKKQNISLFSEHIRKFQMKDTKTWHYGVIAQEVPEMFRNGEEGNMTVNYNSVLSYYVGLLENKVKELEEKIKVLETKLSKLI